MQYRLLNGCHNVIFSRCCFLLRRYISISVFLVDRVGELLLPVCSNLFSVHPLSGLFLQCVTDNILRVIILAISEFVVVVVL